MRPIIWLASYPRSGNTYLRALISNFLHATDAPVPINELSAHARGEHREEIWRELTGKAAVNRSIGEEWTARPRYFERLRALPGDGPLIVKTHTVNEQLEGRPAFEFAPGDRIIHLVRHPGDVAVSSADFYDLDLDAAIERLLSPGLVIDGRPQHGFEVLGSWEQHTRAWLSERRVPMLTVRFFDLVEAPLETLRAIVGLMGHPADPDRIARAVEFARFERLQSQEEQDGFRERPKSSRSGRFFREGRPLQWPRALTPRQVARLIAPNKHLLDQLGFTDFVQARSA